MRFYKNTENEQKVVDTVISLIKDTHKDHPTHYKHLTPSDGSIRGHIRTVGVNSGVRIEDVSETHIESVRQTYRDIGCTPLFDIESKKV